MPRQPNRTMRRLLLVPPAALPASHVFGRDLAPRDYRRYLGQTRDRLDWDASGGLQPNAFAALAATLGDGHDLLLHLPEHYPDGDPDHRRLLDYGEPLVACRDHFNARLRRLISETRDAPNAPPPDTIEHRHQPQIILGRRGRGKTTRLAAKIRWLGDARVLVITPYRSNLERLRALLPDAGNCIFLPPDDALHRLPPSPAAGTLFASAAKTASTSSMKRRKAGWSATRSRFHAMRTDEKGRRNAGLLLWWCYCPYNAVSCPLASTLPFRLKPSTAGVASAGRSRLLSSA